MSRLLLSALLDSSGHGPVEVLVRSDEEWADVVVEADELSLSPVERGSLVVLISPRAQRPWQLDALLRRVRDVGGTGLVLPSSTPLTEGTAALAGRLGLTLLAAGEPTGFARRAWELVTSSDALVLTLVRKVAQAIRYPADDLADQLRHLAAGLGCGVALVAPHGVVLHAGEEFDPALIELIDFDTWSHQLDEPTGAAASVRVDSKTGPRLRLLFHGRSLSSRQLTALTTAAEVAMPAVAARLLIDEVAERDDASRSSSLLSELLDPAAAHDAELDRRVNERGWTTSGWHIGFSVVGRGRAEPLDVLRLVQPTLVTLPASVNVTVRGAGIVGWITFSAAPAQAVIEAAVSALRGLHAAWQLQLSVATGVGTLQRGFRGFSQTIQEATDAARLAVDRSGAEWFVHVDRLGIDRLLMAWTGSDTFRPAAVGLLEPLKPQDRQTLEAYLDHESSLSLTAAALGIHRNTVAQRIARAQEQLGMDLSDADVRLALRLAARVARRSPHGSRRDSAS